MDTDSFRLANEGTFLWRIPSLAMVLGDLGGTIGGFSSTSSAGVVAIVGGKSGLLPKTVAGSVTRSDGSSTEDARPSDRSDAKATWEFLMDFRALPSES